VHDLSVARHASAAPKRQTFTVNENRFSRRAASYSSKQNNNQKHCLLLLDDSVENEFLQCMVNKEKENFTKSANDSENSLEHLANNDFFRVVYNTC